MSPYVKFIPNLEPSKELSYLLGVRYGDMGLVKVESRSQYIIGLQVKDKDFAEEFACTINIILTSEYSVKQDKRGYWVIRACSRLLYEYMTLSLDEHKTVIEKFPENFLRGFFDSEGSPNYRIPKAREGSRSPYIRVNLTESNVLKYVEWLLNQLWIETKWYEFESNKKLVGVPRKSRDGRIHINKKMIYTLQIGKYDSLLLFVKTIGFSIKRKAEKLEDELFV